MIGAANGAAWLVFGGVLLTAIVAGAFVESGGHKTRIRRRSERLAKACKGLPAAKMSQALPAGSIRREEAGGAGILDALARRCLPRQSVLRDRRARTGYAISPWAPT